MEDIHQALSQAIYECFLENVDTHIDISLVDKFHATDLDLLEIVIALQNHFGIDIPDEDFHLLYSTASAVEYLQVRIAELREWICQKE